MTEKPMKDAAHERRRAALRPVYRHIDELVSGHPFCLAPSDDDELGEDNDLLKLCDECLQGMKDSSGRRGHALGAKDMLHLISRFRAHTPAGIFAKARIVRMAGGHAGACVAESMARDILESDAIRRAIWPAEVA